MAMTAAERVKKSQKRCDAIMLRPLKEEGQRIREAAAEAGKPVSVFILDAVREKLKED